MPHRIIGLRGELLVILGALWVLFGLGVITGVGEPTTPSLWHEMLPLPLRIGGWMLTGAIAIIGAWWQRWSDLAIGLLTLMPLQRLVSYLWSWVMHLWPGPPPGDPDGWQHAGYYVGGLALVWFVGRIPASTGPWVAVTKEGRP